MFGISEKIVARLAENGTIDPDDKELYSFGLQQGMVMLINILTTLAIGLVCGMLWQCIVFMIAYMPLRSFAGGYHAKTQLSCYFYSVILILAALAVIRFLTWTAPICIIIAIVSGAVISILAPVEDKNKPLDSVEFSVYKKRTLTILAVELAVIVVLLLFKLIQVSACISVSLIALSVMLVLGKIKNFRYLPHSN